MAVGSDSVWLFADETVLLVHDTNLISLIEYITKEKIFNCIIGMYAIN